MSECESVREHHHTQQESRNAGCGMRVCGHMRVVAPSRLDARCLVWALGFSASRRSADLVARRHSGGRSSCGTPVQGMIPHV